MSTAVDISLDRHVQKVGALVQGFQDRLVHDRYRVLDIVGQGSMGVVFKARDEKLERYVALKIFAGDHEPKNEKDTVYDLYLKESRIAASLSHHNIISIYDIGVLEDAPEKNPFIAMAYIEGSSLQELIEKQTLSITEIARIFYALAGALEYAHSRKQAVLHRDIKPKNILIATGNKPILIDFGMSRFLDAGSTTACMFKGSASFMAPELLEAYCHLDTDGLKRALHPASDLYSLGATFYRAVVGENPFPGPSFYEVLQGVRHAEPTPPSQVNSAIPIELSRIILALLEKNPEKRIQSVELKKQLRTFIESSAGGSELEANDESVDNLVPERGDGFADDIMDDEKFKDVEELQALRRQPESVPTAKLPTTGSEIDAEKVRQLVELIHGQYAEKSRKWSLKSGAIIVGAGIIVVVALSFFASPKKKEALSAKTSSELQEKLAKLPLRPPPLAEGTTLQMERAARQTEASTETKPVSSGTNDPAVASKMQASYRSTGNELVVFSRKTEKKQEMAHGVPAGSEIREVYLLNKVVSFNIATPVKASLRLDFKLEGQDEVILPRDSIFIGEAQVGKSNDRVIINFFQVITPDQKTIQLNGTALMEDGSLGLVGAVNWPKGKSPILQASKDILGTAGRVAISGLDADSYGERIGKSIGAASMNNTGKILQEDYQKLPEITVEALSPLKIYLNDGF